MNILNFNNMKDEDYRLIKLIEHEGQIARHFKGDLYLIINANVTHTETNERMVLYKALYDNCRVYVRPAKMFIEKCTQEQFNKYGQEYRFSFIELESRNK